MVRPCDFVMHTQSTTDKSMIAIFGTSISLSCPMSIATTKWILHSDSVVHEILHAYVNSLISTKCLLRTNKTTHPFCNHQLFWFTSEHTCLILNFIYSKYQGSARKRCFGSDIDRSQKKSSLIRITLQNITNYLEKKKPYWVEYFYLSKQYFPGVRSCLWLTYF